MRKKIRLLLITVLFADLLVVGAFFVGSGTPTHAGPGKIETLEEQPDFLEVGVEEARAANDAMQESLRLLGEELARRTEELDRREADVAEILRGGEVLRRAGLEPEIEPAQEGEAAAASDGPSPMGESFQRLARAYENMEPESAARALIELAGLDQEAVVELLIGWKPRTSGAILDAITQTAPGLAADLSYEIWVRSGKSGPAPATNGR